MTFLFASAFTKSLNTFYKESLPDVNENNSPPEYLLAIWITTTIASLITLIIFAFTVIFGNPNRKVVFIHSELWGIFSWWYNYTVRGSIIEIFCIFGLFFIFFIIMVTLKYIYIITFDYEIQLSNLMIDTLAFGSLFIQKALIVFSCSQYIIMLLF